MIEYLYKIFYTNNTYKLNPLSYYDSASNILMFIL